MKVTLRFAGGEEIARQLDKLAHAVTRTILLRALKRAAEPMRAKAEALAPRSATGFTLSTGVTGHLQDFIVISTVNRVGSVEGGRWQEALGQPWVAVGPRKDFFYGLFQEYGTQRHGAQPFMRPAFDSEAPMALVILREELWTAIRAQLPEAVPTQGAASRELLAA